MGCVHLWEVSTYGGCQLTSHEYQLDVSACMRCPLVEGVSLQAMSCLLEFVRFLLKEITSFMGMA